MSQIQKLSYVFILTSAMTDAVLVVCSRAPEKNPFVCIHTQWLCVCNLLFQIHSKGGGEYPLKICSPGTDDYWFFTETNNVDNAMQHIVQVHYESVTKNVSFLFIGCCLSVFPLSNHV